MNAGLLLLTLSLIAIRMMELRMDSPLIVHARPASANSTQSPKSTPTSASTKPAVPADQAMLATPLVVTNGLPARQDLRWSEPVAEPVFARFIEWANQYRSADAVTKSELEVEGIAIARERRDAMSGMIRTNPARALELVVPVGVRQSLPESVTGLLEERVSGRGSLDVFAALAEPGQESRVTPTFRTATINGREYQAFVYGRRLGEPTRRDIPVNGVAVDDLLAMDENPLRMLEPEESASLKIGPEEPLCSVSGKPSTIDDTPVAADLGGSFTFFCAPVHAAQMNEQLIRAEVAGDTGGGGGEVQANVRTEGTKKLLLIRVDFSDLPGVPFSDATGINLISGLNDFFLDQSYGRSGFYLNGAGSTVTPTLRMPQTASYYGGNNAYFQLRTDARNAAVAAGYTLANYDYEMYCFGAVPGWYWAGLGYVGASGVWLRSYFTVGVAGHELGHNYGLNHANFWDTGDQGTDDDDESVEYGDMFDTMGSANGGAYHFNARYKSYMNWLTASETLTVTSSGIYRIYPHDDATATGLRGLRIVRSSTTNYWVEFRQKFAANKWLMNGAGLRWAGNGNERSHLLDTTPGSPDGKVDSALVVGRTFSDHTAGIHITTLRKGGTSPESLDVVVNLGTFPGNVAPTVTVSADSTSVGLGTTVMLSTVAADNEGDMLAYYWDFGDGTFGTNGATASKSWHVAGEYLVRCVASDMKGGVGSDSILVTVGSPSTYRISGRVTSSGIPVQGTRVAVSNAKVTYTDSDGTYTLSGLPAGGYTVSASLNGFAYNPSGFANPVYVGPNAGNINFGSGGSGVTNPATVSVTSPANNASYSAPASVFLAANASAATGDTIAKVEFYQGTTKLGEDAAFPYSYTWSNASAGTYTLTARLIQGSSTSITSAPVTINIMPVAPAITGQPQNQAVSAGGNASFAVTVTGSAPVTYRWRFNGAEIAGANNATLSLFNVQPPQAGSYSVAVSNSAGSVVSSAATLTVTCDYTLAANSRAFGAAGGSGSVGVTAQGSCSWSVANVPSWITITSGNGGSGNGTVNYSVATNTTSASRNATFLIAGRTYTVTQSPPDLTRPTVAFASPTANALLTNAQVTVTGTAGDNDAVTRVDIRVGSGAFVPAIGTDSWTTTVTLAPGTNLVHVRSLDASGNISETNTRSLFCAVPGRLSLAVRGNGQVKGATNGQSLHIGKLLKLTAAPMPGYVFSNWTGDVSGASPTLSFLMESNLAVTANFVTNPFVPIKGSFNGLFYETNEVRVGSSGSFSFKLTGKGSYSASLRLGGKKLTASGKLDLAGQATNTIRRPGDSSLTLTWAADLTGSDQIGGTVSGGNWIAQSLGDRAAGNATNPAAPPGKYTLILLGSPGTPFAPGGDSYGTASVNTKGVVSVKGSLADKTAFAAKVPLSRNGQWPLHASLYGGKGTLLGWVAFADGPTTDLDGVMSWIKPSLPTAQFYPDGFTSEAALLGSRYTPPVGNTNRVLGLTNTAVLLAGGNLSQSFTNDVVLGLGSKVTNASPHQLAMSFTLSSGLYSGAFTPPGAVKPIGFKGVVLQKGNYGSGHFLGTNQSGWAGFGSGSLSPANPFEPSSFR